MTLTPFPAALPTHYNGEFPLLDEAQKDLAIAHLKEQGEDAVLVALHEQAMGEPLRILYSLYFGAALEALLRDGLFPGPRSTEFEVPADLKDYAGEECYGDSDFDSLNNIAYEAWFTHITV